MAPAAASLSPDPSFHGSSQERGAGSGLALPPGATREPSMEPVPAASSAETPWEPHIPSQRLGREETAPCTPQPWRPSPTRNSQSHLGNLSGD